MSFNKSFLEIFDQIDIPSNFTVEYTCKTLNNSFKYSSKNTPEIIFADACILDTNNLCDRRVIEIIQFEDNKQEINMIGKSLDHEFILTCTIIHIFQ